MHFEYIFSAYTSVPHMASHLLVFPGFVELFSLIIETHCLLVINC